MPKRLPYYNIQKSNKHVESRLCNEQFYLHIHVLICIFKIVHGFCNKN